MKVKKFQCKNCGKMVWHKQSRCRKCWSISRKGHPTPNLTKQKIGKKAKERWSNRTFRKMNIAVLKKSFKTPEYRRKMRKIYNSKEFREFQRQKFLGKNNPRWNGGYTINYSGYKYVSAPNHPFRNKHGYIREHRLIIEQQIGRYLSPMETPHHLGEKDDNRSNMLMAFATHSAHMRFHKNPNNVKPKEIIFDGRNIIHI